MLAKEIFIYASSHTGKSNMSFEATAAVKIVSEIIKRVLKRDPFEYAIEKTLKELEKDNGNDLIVLDEIYHNRDKIFDTIDITNESAFKNTLAKHHVKSETSSRLYKELTTKFRGIVIEMVVKNQDVFRAYIKQELEKIKHEQKINAGKILYELEKIGANAGNTLDDIQYITDILHLTTIEFELKTGIENNGKFFRPEGPLWIDFQEGYVAKRKEVEKIIDAFDKGLPYLLLEGGAASGKSVIARNVGYELANKLDVFYINSKELETHKVDAIFNDVIKLKEGSIIIIEDAHLYPNYCDNLMKDIHVNVNANVKILLTARPTYNLHRHVPYLDICKKFTLSAFDSVDAIIKIYIKKNRLPQPNIEEMENLKDQSKESLWVLAYFLTAWEPGKPIEINKVYDKVYNDLKELDEKYTVGSQDVILALAPFYQHEIRIIKPFLTLELKLKEEAIKKLVDAGEIKDSEGYISLHHSAIAEIYIKTSEIHADLIYSLLYKLNQFNKNAHNIGAYVAGMYQCYLRSQPINYDEVIRNVRLKKDLIEKIFMDGHTRNAIFDSYAREPDIEKSGNYIRDISYISKNIDTELANSLDLDNLRKKIEKEPDIEKIGSFVGSVLFTNREIGNALVGTVKSKIEKESDIKKIGNCISNISYDCSQFGKSLVLSLDLNNIISKIENEPDILQIGGFVRNILSVSTEIGTALVNVIIMKIENETDIEKIGICISDISFASREIGELLTDLNYLGPKIQNEHNFEKIKAFISDISLANNEVGKALVDIAIAELKKTQNSKRVNYSIQLYLGKNKKQISEIQEDFNEFTEPIMDSEVLCSYVESEIPVYLGFNCNDVRGKIKCGKNCKDYHSFIAVDCIAGKDGNVSHFIIYDDICASYVEISTEMINENLHEAVVLFPENIHMRYEIVLDVLPKIINARTINKSIKDGAKIIFRSFLMRSQRVKYWYTNKELYPPEIQSLYLQADFPRYVWVFEIGIQELAENNRCIGQIIIDASKPEENIGLVLMNFPEYRLWHQNKELKVKLVENPTYKDFSLYRSSSNTKQMPHLLSLNTAWFLKLRPEWLSANSL